MISLLLTFQLEQHTLTDYHKVKVLNAIKQVESRNCQDTKHKVMKKGIHKGQSAIGCYGLMPKTIRTVYRGIADEKDILSSISNPNAFKSILDVDYSIASMLYDKLDKRYQGNTKKIVYSWLHGSSKKGYASHWYVKRVINHMGE